MRSKLFRFLPSVLLAALLAATPLFAASQQAPAPNPQRRALADSCQRKLEHIERNGERTRPDPRPTELREEEINACFAEGRIPLPRGVERLRFRGEPGLITADARVDFDEVRAGQKSSHPLLFLFSGTHDVRVVAKTSGAGGRGVVDVQQVFINDMAVPRAALEYFVKRYLTPRYPQVGMVSRFGLPARIDRAEVGEKKLTVAQK